MRDVLTSTQAPLSGVLIKQEPEEDHNFQKTEGTCCVSNCSSRRGFSIDSILGTRQGDSFTDLHRLTYLDKKGFYNGERRTSGENRNISGALKSTSDVSTNDQRLPSTTVSGVLDGNSASTVLPLDATTTQNHRCVPCRAEGAGKLPNISRFFEPLECLMPFTESPCGDSTPGRSPSNQSGVPNIPLLKDMPVLRNFGRIEMNNRAISGGDALHSSSLSASVKSNSLKAMARNETDQSSSQISSVENKTPDKELFPIPGPVPVTATGFKSEPDIKGHLKASLSQAEHFCKGYPHTENREENTSYHSPASNLIDPSEKENEERLRAIHRALCAVASHRKVKCLSIAGDERSENESRQLTSEMRSHQDSADELKPFSMEALASHPCNTSQRPCTTTQPIRGRRLRQDKSKDVYMEGQRGLGQNEEQAEQYQPHHVFHQHQLFVVQPRSFSDEDEHLYHYEKSLKKILPCEQAQTAQQSPLDKNVEIAKFRRSEKHARLDEYAAAKRKAKDGYVCDKCGKSYCRKYVLKIHQRVHSGEKPLICQICGKSFSDPSNMKKHVKLHETDHVTYPCKFCGRCFVRRRGLLNHLHSMHSRLPSTCENESKSLMQVDDQV